MYPLFLTALFPLTACCYEHVHARKEEKERWEDV
jgi:hypothetical protein